MSDHSIHWLPLIQPFQMQKRDKMDRFNFRICMVNLRENLVNKLSLYWITLAEFPPFLQGKQLSWLSVCFLAHEAPSEIFSFVTHYITEPYLRTSAPSAVWSESSLGTFWVASDAKCVHADNEDANQTARIRRLIWVHLTHMSEGTFSHVTAHMGN